MAIDSTRLGGIAYIAVDGQNYLLRGELTYSPGNIARETVIGQDVVQGFLEKPRPPFISGTLSDSDGLTVSDFNAMTSVTVTLQLANGKMVTGNNMWTVEAQEVDTAEGKFAVKWECAQALVETA